MYMHILKPTTVEVLKIYIYQNDLNGITIQWRAQGPS